VKGIKFNSNVLRIIIYYYSDGILCA